MRVSDELKKKAEAERKRCTRRAATRTAKRKKPSDEERGSYENIIDRQGAAPLMPEEAK